MKTHKEGSLSLANCGLKYKLKISFYLTSVLPLLVCIYLVANYILPQVGLRLDVGASILISIVITVIGFFLIKEVFDRIMSVTSEAKLIASGDINHRVKVSAPDEVGDLGDALNQLTQRIRSNMDELKSYGEKTTEINLEIQRRVIVLSSLLQVSALISQGEKIEDILKLTVEKSRLLANSDFAFLLFREEGKDIFHMKTVDGLDSERLTKVSVSPAEGLFANNVFQNRPFIADAASSSKSGLAAEFSGKFGLKNGLCLPVYLKGRVVGILGIGNNQNNFSYKKDDIELMDIFAKQIAIAEENDLLMHRVEKLEIKDALTGLYNEGFIRGRLEEEIKRSIAYQRPCAFVIFDLDNFQKFRQEFGALEVEAALKKIATLIRDSVSEIDRVARIGDDEFGVLLPEKNKRQAQEAAERIREKIENEFSSSADLKKRMTASAGVSENPLDGTSAAELIAEAKNLVRSAKEKGRNRVVGFRGRA